MSRIQDLYDTRVRQMPPAERLQVARLIIDEFAPSKMPLDVSDDWSEDDLADLAAFSAQKAERSGDDGRSTL